MISIQIAKQPDIFGQFEFQSADKNLAGLKKAAYHYQDLN